MKLPIPTQWLALLAVILAVGVFALPDIGATKVVFTFDHRFLLANAVLLVVALFDWLAAYSPEKVNVERQFPTAVSLGKTDTLQWQFSLAGDAPRSTRVAVAEEFAPSLNPEEDRFSFSLEPTKVTRISTTITPQRRGKFTFEQITVRTFGPLGLIAKQHSFVEPTSIKIVPVFKAAKEAELAIKRSLAFDAGSRSTVNLGGGTQFEAMREMTPDDETRRIDWAATARMNKPIVRTYRAEDDQSVLALVDSGRLMSGLVEGIPRFDYAMDATMLLTELVTGVGDRIGLVAFDRHIAAHVTSSAHSMQRHRVNDALFNLHPALAESDYEQAVTYVLSQYKRRSFVFLFTELAPGAIEQFLFPALPLITRKHLLVIASLRDPNLKLWAEQDPQTNEEFYRGMAAREALEDREKLVAELRSRAVIVLDEEPQNFNRALSDTYLRAKSSGRL